MKKKINLNELIWFFILIGLTFYFYRIISTNKLILFVHPKMVMYVKFALYFLIILAIFQGKNVLTYKKSKRLKFGYILFLIPLLLGFLLKPEGLSIASAINKGFSLTSQLKINTLKHKHTVLEDGTEVCEHNDESTHFIDNADVAPVDSLENISPLKEDTINMTNKNFVNNYEDIYGNPHNYFGRAISMKGFIYKQKGLNEEEFILSRILVSCCAADAQLVGVLCGYSQGKMFTEGTWVNIEGILREKEYKDAKSGKVSIIPIIKVSEIEKIDNQDNEYIFN